MKINGRAKNNEQRGEKKSIKTVHCTAKAEWSKNNRKTNDFCQLAWLEMVVAMTAINEHKQVESIDWKIGKLMILIDFVDDFNFFCRLLLVEKKNFFVQ